MKLTDNFSLNEFQCSCGCDMPEEVYNNVTKLVVQLQALRDYLKRSITVNSAYRCKKHNKAIGGVKSSQHILGTAADIVISRQEPKETRKIIEELINDGIISINGVGSYSNFTHVDIRENKARW